MWRTESRQRERVGAAFFTIMESSRVGMVASESQRNLQSFLTRLTPLGCAEAHPYNCWVCLAQWPSWNTAWSWAWLVASWSAGLGAFGAGVPGFGAGCGDALCRFVSGRWTLRILGRFALRRLGWAPFRNMGRDRARKFIDGEGGVSGLARIAWQGGARRVAR